jgi:predicted ATPase
LAFLRDIVKLGVDEAVKRHGGAEAIICRTQEDRLVSLGIECEYTISGEADRWHATYQIDVEFPKTRPANICREELRIEQGQWWVGYTNEAGRVTCGAADDQPQQWEWRTKERPALDAYGTTPVPEFAACLEALTAYHFHPDAIRRLQKASLGRLLERDGSNLPSVITALQQADPDSVQRDRRMDQLDLDRADLERQAAAQERAREG